MSRYLEIAETDPPVMAGRLPFLCCEKRAFFLRRQAGRDQGKKIRLERAVPSELLPTHTNLSSRSVVSPRFQR